MTKVTIYSRHGCHLCEVAEQLAQELQKQFHYSLEIEFIDGNPQLEREYGEKVPVTLIDGQPHDYWRIDRDRFTQALTELNLS